MLHNRQEGFTLVELLTVVAILAILSAIFIPLAGQYKERAAVAADTDCEKNAAKQAESFLSTDIITAYDRSNGSFFDYKGKVADGMLLYYAVNPGSSGETSGAELIYVDTSKTGSDYDNLKDLLKYGQCRDHEGKYILIKIQGGSADTDWVPSWSMGWATFSDATASADAPVTKPHVADYDKAHE